MFSCELTKWGIIFFIRTDNNHWLKKLNLFQYRSIETPIPIPIPIPTLPPQWKYEIWKHATNQIISPLLTLSSQWEKSNHLIHTKKNIFWKKIRRKNGTNLHTPITKLWRSMKTDYENNNDPSPTLPF